MFSQVDSEGHQFQIMSETTYHKTDGRSVNPMMVGYHRVMARRLDGKIQNDGTLMFYGNLGVIIGFH